MANVVRRRCRAAWLASFKTTQSNDDWWQHQSDGLVNIDDLNNVCNNFSQTGNPDGILPGDSFSFDGRVDVDDLNAVRNNVGAGAVPEPATAWLLLFGLVLSCAMTRRRE